MRASVAVHLRGAKLELGEVNVLRLLRAVRLSPPSRSSQYRFSPEHLPRHRRPLHLPRRPPGRLVGKRLLRPPGASFQGSGARSALRDRVGDGRLGLRPPPTPGRGSGPIDRSGCLPLRLQGTSLLGPSALAARRPTLWRFGIALRRRVELGPKWRLLVSEAGGNAALGGLVACGGL